MNSYQHITDRNEFIEKFRQDQGLPMMSRNETSNTLSKSRIIYEPSIREVNDGRWDYLYSLEKLKQAKLNEQRRIKKMQVLQKENLECTFSPKVNRDKSIKNFTNRNLPRSYNFDLNGISNLLSNEREQKPHIGLNLLDRQQQWAYKKNMHIENIKNEQVVKDIQECIFKPKLVFIF